MHENRGYQVGRHSGGCGSTMRSLSISTIVDAGVLTSLVRQFETLLLIPFLLINLIYS
jgi:hypothetical protein